MIDYFEKAFRVVGPITVIMVGCLAIAMLALVASIFGAL
jgi:hypothetical protein